MGSYLRPPLNNRLFIISWLIDNKTDSDMNYFNTSASSSLWKTSLNKYGTKMFLISDPFLNQNGSNQTNIQQNFEKHFPTHYTKVVALWKEQTSKFLKVHGLNFIVFSNIELSHRNLFIHIFYAWLQLVPQVFEIAVNKHFICKVNTKGGGWK